ncbi:tetratricopeptide repeat protein, partial [Kamptonema sp. UHCC 0994]|uniref:tetratricopeptide repeat protein n=1 Tax=Kamptonema sp. UHCC 0994 TaxID=3031329 RepID=UPI0031B9D03A
MNYPSDKTPIFRVKSRRLDQNLLGMVWEEKLTAKAQRTQREMEMLNQEADAWFDRAKEQDERGDFEGAIASYDKAIKFKPDDHKVWNNRGLALFNLGQFEEAIASYDKAIEFKPDDHEAWNNRGLALDDLGRIEEAIASYDKAIEIKPD